MWLVKNTVEDKIHGSIVGDNSTLSYEMYFTEVSKGKGKENVGDTKQIITHLVY